MQRRWSADGLESTLLRSLAKVALVPSELVPIKRSSMSTMPCFDSEHIEVFSFLSGASPTAMKAASNASSNNLVTETPLND